MDRFFQNYSDVLSVHDVRKILGIGRTKTYELLQNNLIEYFRIGSTYKIPKLCLIKYIDKELHFSLDNSMQKAEKSDKIENELTCRLERSGNESNRKSTNETK